MEVEHLLAEPQSEKDLIVDVMHLNSENTNTCLDNEDFPCKVGCYNPKKDFGKTYEYVVCYIRIFSSHSCPIVFGYFKIFTLQCI